MHAPSQALGKRAAAALVAVLSAVLAGCATSGSDTPALGQPSTSGATRSPGGTGPDVSITKVQGIPVPRLASTPAADAALERIGAGLRGSCTLTTTRDDASVASFRWTCGSSVAGATVAIGRDRLLTLADLFAGRYQAYLSSTAQAQLVADGVAHPDTSTIAAWDLTPTSFEAFYPSGSVSFPLTSLEPYLRSPQG